MRFGRGGVVVGAGVVLVVLVLASVAAACVPSVYVDHDKFVVTPGEGAPGSVMTALGGTNGTYVEKKNHPYTIKLLAGTFNPNDPLERRRCGDLGIPQVVAISDSSYRFSADFVLDGVVPGPAHFCALAGLQKETSELSPATEFYIRHTTIL